MAGRAVVGNLNRLELPGAGAAVRAWGPPPWRAPSNRNQDGAAGPSHDAAKAREEAKRPGEIYVAGRPSIRSLGGRIAKDIRRERSVSLRSVGKESAYWVVKAAALARGFLQVDGGPHELQGSLCLMPETSGMAVGLSGEDMLELCFRGHMLNIDLKKPRLSIFAEDTTSAQQLSHLVAEHVRSDGALLVHGLGVNAVAIALEAVSLAKTHLETEDSTGTLTLIPAFQDTRRGAHADSRLSQATLEVCWMSDQFKCVGT
eukprot:gnl/MRDRNA2_/MRDRNA2_164304_c0_seq1.p1 gnl/MRDRNA2_/MRDRNA2_164304_c0~~gnl/MRDRNA2_/MRDRNA2_164304_c0_seq1.p1  ORF type:complete len:259 (-),score=48.69 gnl/MRDRNA2_/MRDRNA2_164304_c0_seq1:94-870(-)